MVTCETALKGVGQAGPLENAVRVSVVVMPFEGQLVMPPIEGVANAGQL